MTDVDDQFLHITIDFVAGVTSDQVSQAERTLGSGAGTFSSAHDAGTVKSRNRAPLRRRCGAVLAVQGGVSGLRPR